MGGGGSGDGIREVVQTEKEGVVQFVYEESNPGKRTYIITWDLITNMELSLLRIPNR